MDRLPWLACARSISDGAAVLTRVGIGFGVLLGVKVSAKFGFAMATGSEEVLKEGGKIAGHNNPRAIAAPPRVGRSISHHLIFLHKKIKSAPSIVHSKAAVNIPNRK